MSSEVTSRRLFAATMLLALAFTSLIQSGCTRPIRRLGILDELAITYRDRVWAQRAYNLRFANCNREYGDHFKNGFCAGYADVCNGGDGYLPALPPETYRGYEYQCAEGSKCVDTWFEGYPAGVAAAREEKAGQFHEMHVSRMIDRAVTQSNASNVLPADVPVTKPSAKLLPPRNFKDLLASTEATDEELARAISPSPVAAKKRRGLKPKATITKAAPTPQPKIAAPQSVMQKPVEVVEAKTKPLPTKQVEPIRVPPIVTATRKAPDAATLVAKEPEVKTALPPIVRVKPAAKKPTSLPPIVRGNKIDPAAAVSSNEIPLPMSVKVSNKTRSAAWPINRK
jgi:hypothetical protein